MLEKIHGKLIIRAHFQNPNRPARGRSPIVYTSHFITRDEASEQYLEFTKLNQSVEFTGYWIPYPERLEVD
jgi:hypothetical protein